MCEAVNEIISVSTSILPGDWCIGEILMLILRVLVYGLGVAATVGVVVAGIFYMTARDNEAQVTKAKTRLYEIIIGLVAWALMFTVLNWLIPGGINVNDPAVLCPNTSTSTNQGGSSNQNQGGGGGNPNSSAQTQ